MSNIKIELNGVANIKLLMDKLVKTMDNNDEQLIEVAKIYQQLDYMERYMVAIADAVQKNESNPFWHEIRTNKDSFRLNGGSK